MVIEFARNVCGLDDADSTEFNPGTPHRVIFKLRELKGVDELGGTMRLGSWPCQLAEGSFAHEAYGAREISERHRHRYEFNREYEDQSEGRAACGSPARRPTASTSRSARSPTIRGFSAASSIPSSSRSRWSRIRCSRRSSARRRIPAAATARACRRSEEPLFSPCRLSFERLRDPGKPLVLIAGPCVIESEEHVHRMARGDPRRSSGDVRLQSVLRQGQPHQRRTPIAARA